MNENLATGPIYSSLATEPDLMELVASYVDVMPQRIATLLEAYESGNYEQMEVQSHQLKGTLGSYGFDELTPLAAQLERKVKTREPEEEILEAVQALTEQCRRLSAEMPPTE